LSNTTSHNSLYHWDLHITFIIGYQPQFSKVWGIIFSCSVAYIMIMNTNHCTTKSEQYKMNNHIINRTWNHLTLDKQFALFHTFHYESLFIRLYQRPWAYLLHCVLCNQWRIITLVKLTLISIAQRAHDFNHKSYKLQYHIPYSWLTLATALRQNCHMLYACLVQYGVTYCMHTSLVQYGVTLYATLAIPYI